MSQDKSRLEELKKQGWTMRFAAGEPRLSEAADLYRASGFEVLLEPLPESLPCSDCAGEEAAGQCRICYQGHEDQYKLIFTRLSADGKNNDEELF